MRTKVETIAEIGHKVMVVEYESPRDLVKQMEVARATAVKRANKTDWSGGTEDYFKRGMRGEVQDYVAAAQDKITQFGNIALADWGVSLDQNIAHGMLDYQAAMAGDPMCMYGATIRENNRTATDIYIDPWVSADVKPEVITARGIGILALVQALSVFRPVNAYILKGSHHMPADMDTIQTLQIPTMPMDLTRASFILCSPTTNRHGFLSAIHAAHGSKRECNSPPMNAAEWQQNGGMAAWMAARNDVKDYLFMSGTFDASFWNDNVLVIDWIKQQIDTYVGKAAA